MNYGRFFRLNQSLSKAENGVAIYDYIDLPAYFGPSVDNPMSPKYPISVTITSNVVSFHLHYSAFKIEKKEEENKKETPHYAYDEDDIDNKTFPIEHGFNPNRIGMAHMEEIILELPFLDDASNKLSNIIKEIYNTKFPQIVDDNTSMGGRFLEQLIRKRYPLKGENIDSGAIEEGLYRRLREVTDNTVSYSTLCLMDLIRNERINIYEMGDNKQQDPPIIGFLRKLLLDFMFDLKHSDVFQNSAHYQEMTSGLMSDFYFSALMHKCEYYYYRKLTNLAISQSRKADRKKITGLYADELTKAETLWVSDVMNPLAENYFEYRFSSLSKFPNAFVQNANKTMPFGFFVWLMQLLVATVRFIIKALTFIGSVFFERLTTSNWPSWFAEPEEEMRRICFPMSENGKKVICNTDSLVNYLCLEAKDGEAAKKIIESRNENKAKISQWFLKRYDFNDIIHLHTLKHFNFILFITILYFTFLLFSNRNIGMSMNYMIEWFGNHSTYLWSILFIALAYHLYWCSKWSKMVFIHKWSKIKKLLFEGYIIGILGLLAYQYLNPDVIVNTLILKRLVIVGFSVCLIGYFSAKFDIPLVRYLLPPFPRFISYLHLMLPKLVSAITAAWLTISLGFDIYVSFFDSEPSWSTAIAISMIVLGFIMYEIDRIMPRSTSIRKLYRSFELLCFSYCISLLVGLVVINFVGEKFLERGQYMDVFYDEYVNADRDSTKQNLSYHQHLYYDKIKDAVDTSTSYGKVDGLRKISHKKNNESVGDSIVGRPTLFGSKHDLFILRDFLIMFSFIAMFWGIFIQMIFTGEKQMTEL